MIHTPYVMQAGVDRMRKMTFVDVHVRTKLSPVESMASTISGMIVQRDPAGGRAPSEL